MQQINVVVGDASAGGQGDDSIWNQRGYGYSHGMCQMDSDVSTSPRLNVTYARGQVRGRRGRPRGSRRGQGASHSLTHLHHQDMLDRTNCGTGTNGMTGTGTTGYRGKVRGRQGRRPYGSRRVQGANWSFTNPLHQDMLHRTNSDSGANDMTGSAYTSSLSQFSAVSGPGVSCLIQDPSAASNTGTTERSILAVLYSYSQFLVSVCLDQLENHESFGFILVSGIKSLNRICHTTAVCMLLQLIV